VSPGVGEDRGNRWVLAEFTAIGLAAGFLPAYRDRLDFWTIDGDGVRWAGVFLFTAGGVLRLWPVFVPGRRFSGLAAIQSGHTLVTALGWAMGFRSGAGLLLFALLVPPLVARMNAEERRLDEQGTGGFPVAGPLRGLTATEQQAGHACADAHRSGLTFRSKAQAGRPTTQGGPRPHVRSGRKPYFCLPGRAATEQQAGHACADASIRPNVQVQSAGREAYDTGWPTTAREERSETILLPPRQSRGISPTAAVGFIEIGASALL